MTYDDNKMTQISLNPIKLETERLVVHPFSMNDLEKSILLYGNPKITKYFDYGKPRSRQEVIELVKMSCAHFQKGKPFGLFSIFQKNNGRFIGHIDCLPSDEEGVIEIGCILHHKYQNQGFGLEVASLFIHEYLPKIKTVLQENILGVVVTAHPDNITSRKLIEKMGMRIEQTIIRFNQPRIKYFLEIS